MLSHHEENKQSELFHLYTDCSAKLGKINEPHLYHYQDCAFVYLVLWGSPWTEESTWQTLQYKLFILMFI